MLTALSRGTAPAWKCEANFLCNRALQFDLQRKWLEWLFGSAKWSVHTSVLLYVFVLLRNHRPFVTQMRKSHFKVLSQLCDWVTLFRHLRFLQKPRSECVKALHCLKPADVKVNERGKWPLIERWRGWPSKKRSLFLSWRSGYWVSSDWYASEIPLDAPHPLPAQRYSHCKRSRRKHA